MTVLFRPAQRGDAREMMAALEQQVGVESRPEGGSCFFLTLERAR